MNIPYKNLPKKTQEEILHGIDEQFEIDYVFDNGNNKRFKTRFEGIIPFLERKQRETDQNDAFARRLYQYITEIECPACE